MDENGYMMGISGSSEVEIPKTGVYISGWKPGMVITGRPLPLTICHPKREKNRKMIGIPET